MADGNSPDFFENVADSTGWRISPGFTVIKILIRVKMSETNELGNTQITDDAASNNAALDAE